MSVNRALEAKPPCDCCTQYKGEWICECQCMNIGDAQRAAVWCAEQNERPVLVDQRCTNYPCCLPKGHDGPCSSSPHESASSKTVAPDLPALLRKGCGLGWDSTPLLVSEINDLMCSAADEIERLRRELASIGEYDCPGGVHPRHCAGCAACDANKALEGITVETNEDQPCVSHMALQEWPRMFDAWVKHQAGLQWDVPLWPNADWYQDVAMVAHALARPDKKTKDVLPKQWWIDRLKAQESITDKFVAGLRRILANDRTLSHDIAREELAGVPAEHPPVPAEVYWRAVGPTTVEPIATVINNNQPGWTNIVETAPNVTLNVGSPLYSQATVDGLVEDRRIAMSYLDEPRAQIENLTRCLTSCDSCDCECHAAETPTGLYTHWRCDTHGDFDARVAVGCPECTRQMREALRRAYDAFSIGRDARTPAALLANIENARRRSDCLSAIEREFFTRPATDEDGEETQECSLGWGAEPDNYVEQFRAALRERAAVKSPETNGWQLIETAPKNKKCLYYVISKPAEECYTDGDGKQIVSNREPSIELTKFGGWSSLRKATHWAPIPPPPISRSPERPPVHPDPTGQTREPPHCQSCACGMSPQAPIAKLTIREGLGGPHAPDDLSVSLYSPGLPPGEYDLFIASESEGRYLSTPLHGERHHLGTKLEERAPNKCECGIPRQFCTAAHDASWTCVRCGQLNSGSARTCGRCEDQ